jgi:hypothetical protein
MPPKIDNNALEATMPETLASLLRSEREASDPIDVASAPKLHSFVESWPKPQKPTYGVAPFTAKGESRRRRIASVLFREIEQRGGKVALDKWHERDPEKSRPQSRSSQRSP